MDNRTGISLLISMMVSAVLFGVGAVLVLSVPALSARASVLLPVVIAASFVISPFISWYLAPRLRGRWQRRHART